MVKYKDLDQSKVHKFPKGSVFQFLHETIKKIWYPFSSLLLYEKNHLVQIWWLIGLYCFEFTSNSSCFFLAFIHSFLNRLSIIYEIWGSGLEHCIPYPSLWADLSPCPSGVRLGNTSWPSLETSVGISLQLRHHTVTVLKFCPKSLAWESLRGVRWRRMLKM